MNRIKFTAVALTLGLLSSAALAGDGYTANAAFQDMLKLEGTWTGEARVVPVGANKEDMPVSTSTVTWENIGFDTSIMQTFLAGTPAEMVSMYHQDGPEKLIHTHYCAAKNQPSMAFRDVAEAGVIDFQFTSGTNMDVNVDGHAHNSSMKIIDENTYETRTENWSAGKLASVRYTVMKRVNES
jgi:hypothetical protein